LVGKRAERMKSKLLYFSSGAEGKRRCRRQALGRKFVVAKLFVTKPLSTS
jgi:hypothetical protein